jgi:hypothetical protein
VDSGGGWSDFLGEHPEVAELGKTVTLERSLLMDILLEAYTVTHVIEDLVGTCPTIATHDLARVADNVAAVVLGPNREGPNGVSVGPQVDLWDAAGAKARAFFRELGGESRRRRCT